MVKRNRKSDRNKQILEERNRGDYYIDIAKRHGISIIRVRQIIEAERQRLEKYGA